MLHPFKHLPDEIVSEEIFFFLTATELSAITTTSRAIRRASKESCRLRLKDDELGQSLLRRLPDFDNRYTLERLAFCVELNVRAGMYCDLLWPEVKRPEYLQPQRMKQDISEGKTVGEDLRYIASVRDGSLCSWNRVHFVIDGVAVLEKVEILAGSGRFEVTKVPLPYLLDMLEQSTFAAWKKRTPIPRQNEMIQCWNMGYGLYLPRGGGG